MGAIFSCCGEGKKRGKGGEKRGKKKEKKRKREEGEDGEERELYETEINLLHLIMFNSIIMLFYLLFHSQAKF
jgi:hypothetical protein